MLGPSYITRIKKRIKSKKWYWPFSRIVLTEHIDYETPLILVGINRLVYNGIIQSKTESLYWKSLKNDNLFAKQKTDDTSMKYIIKRKKMNNLP